MNNMDISSTIAQLRRLVPEAAVLPADAAAALPLGVPAADAALGGGLKPGALHEIHAASPREAGAAAGFALGLAGRLMRMRDGPLLWLRHAMAEREYGRFHAPGLAEMGLDPRRLVTVGAGRTDDLLDAALQAMRGLKAGVVLLEPYGQAKELDMTAGRRLALAAEASRGGVTLLTLFSSRDPCPSPALTRWRISAAPAEPGPRHLMGPPRFRAELIRSRTGQTGEWVMEWNSDASIFRQDGSIQGGAIRDGAVSRPQVPLPAHGPAEADHGDPDFRKAEDFRKAG
jgi:protein ImuA